MTDAVYTYAGQMLDQGYNTGPGTGFSLALYPNFPFLEWSTLNSLYAEQTEWYSGRAIQEYMETTGKVDVEKYPVQVNPIPAIVMKHVFALFGDISHDTRPLVVTKFGRFDGSSGIDEGDDNEKNIAKRAEEVISMIWWENFGRSLQLKNAILSQIYGGSIFGLKWVPDQVAYRSIPIKIETVDPRHFIAFPIPGDEFRLQEAWIVKPIDWKTAEYYGVKVDQNQPCYWVEKWTEEEYDFKINDKPIRNPRDPEWKSSGKNIWGFVPYVYIPHIRDTSFWGKNVFDQLKGLIREYNLRLADYGDAVNIDAHNVAWMANVQQQIRVLYPIPGQTVMDLGNTASITGGEQDPIMEELRKPAASAAMKDLVTLLLAEIRRESFVPAIADGEDEGSQRSALTLAMRMWPLISHTGMERVSWSNGLDWFTRMMLAMCLEKQIPGITKEVMRLKTKHQWYPPLPKDRETVVNEVINRASQNLGSPQHLIEMLGDVEDIDEEIELIKEWLEALSEIETSSQMEIAEKEAELAPPPVAGAASATSRKGSVNATGGNRKSSS